jgi:DNA modification methylase
METNRIICGDNCEVMRTMPSESIDLVVTSPPYDNLRTYGGHPWDFEGVVQELWRLIKPGGVVVWVVNDATVNGSETGTSFRQALRFMEIGFRLHDTMIWEKPNGPFPDPGRYFQAWEYMFVFSNGKPKCFNPLKKPNATAGKALGPTYRRNDLGESVLSTENDGKKRNDEGVRLNRWLVVNSDDSKHPAVFPEALARDHILSWSNEGDIVLDPFSGSGTTAKMAKHNGRKYIGIEVNPEYVEISLKRLEQGVLF